MCVYPGTLHYSLVLRSTSKYVKNGIASHTAGGSLSMCVYVLVYITVSSAERQSTHATRRSSSGIGSLALIERRYRGTDYSLRVPI